MKKLLSILGSIAMVGTAGATVVACGKTGETKVETEDSKTRLTKKIDEIKKLKNDIENEQKETWGAVAAKVIEPFNLIISDAEAAVEAEGLTEEVADKHINKLDAGLKTFESKMPKNIISEVIDKQGDIKELFSKSWTHTEFFGVGNYQHQKVIDLFEQSVKNAAPAIGYEGEEITKLGDAARQWALENWTLVYISVDKDGNQYIKDEYKKAESGTTKIEQLFLKSVQDQFPDEDLTDPAFWTKNQKLSLGIKFPKDKLNENIKDFWTFTFAENSPLEQSKDKLQKIIDDAKNEEGKIIFQIKKGRWTTQTQVANAMHQIFMKFFYGKFYVPSHIIEGWASLPNPKQIAAAEGRWDTQVKRIPLLNGKNKLFDIEADYSIEWVE